MHRNFRRTATIAVLAVSTALAGCMSDGASSFTDALNVRQDIPFRTPSAGRRFNRRRRSDRSRSRERWCASGRSGEMTDNRNKLESDPVAARSLAGEQELEVNALAPQTTAQVRGRGNPVCRSFARRGGRCGDGNPLEPQPDPLEVEAELRAEALYSTMKHGQCAGGWGPKPKMVNARRIDPQHKYYMEMRLRHTPPLPVGHVYIAYGRIGPDGEPVDEKLVMLAPVGGYAGATVAAAAPMPGVLEPYGDDCVLRPIAAYRVSLTAQQYEKLLNRVVQAPAGKAEICAVDLQLQPLHVGHRRQRRHSAAEEPVHAIA